MSHYKVFPTQLIVWSLEITEIKLEIRNQYQVDFEISYMILASIRPLALKP